jgi:hypothetical protein
MRNRCRVRQSEISRAIRAALAAGVEVQRVETQKDGRVVLIIRGQEGVDMSVEPSRNPWDEVLDHAADEKRPT